MEDSASKILCRNLCDIWTTKMSSSNIEIDDLMALVNNCISNLYMIKDIHFGERSVAKWIKFEKNTELGSEELQNHIKIGREICKDPIFIEYFESIKTANQNADSGMTPYFAP